MDALDRLLGPAGALLERVDATLTEGGAPPGHPVWPVLLRVRVLPGAAVTAVAALSPESLLPTLGVLRAADATVAGAAATLPGPGEWQGVAAERYDAARGAVRAHLDDTVSGRLAATAALTESMVAWMRATRQAVAVAVGDVLTSAEAVTVREEPTVGPPSAARTAAAADIAVRVLAAVAESYDTAADLCDDRTGLTVPVRYRQ
jgi:hypothetical protein